MTNSIGFFRLFFLVILYVWATEASAQVLKPAKWATDVSKKEVAIGEEIELIFNVEIQAEWYLYSTDFDPDLGPQVTEFTFTPHDSYALVGKIVPVNPKKKYSDVFGGDYTYFTEKAQFRQKIKILKPNLSIQGKYSYQVCTDKDGKCIPFSANFTFDNIQVVAAKKNDKKTEDKTDKAENTSKDSSSKATEEAIANPKDSKNQANSATKQTNKGSSVSPTTTAGNTSMGWFLVVAFSSGLLALLTPCVFPMIPMTVSYFTKQSENGGKTLQKAIVYGVSIMVIYTIIGVLFSVLFGAGIQNWLSTHWIPNLFFFIVLVAFALSFFGMFELVLPSSWVNSADQQADKGGYYGIFFMAFTLALVSFSCTAPIVGTVLIQASQGEFFRPVVGMLAFSSAVALPFTLFAIFPSWLSKLPKSGGWLNSVKVVLGFLELALALKFLSQIDVVYHLRILDREIFLALWIVIFSLLGFYLLGKIQLPHDSRLEKIPVSRFMVAMLTFAFVVYLIPGMFGAPLRALSGYLPPQTTFETWQIQNCENVSALQTSGSGSAGSDEKIRHSEFLKLPLGLKGFFDFKQGLAYAKKVNKPIFIDFTGHGCTNCREMEARVWSDKKVLSRLKEDFVVIALYVDDRTNLPQNEWYTSIYDKQVKKTIGDQNLDFQISQFNANAQPLYCLLNAEGKLLIEPKAYDLNIDHFAKFLDAGKEAFKAKQVSMQ